MRRIRGLAGGLMLVVGLSLCVAQEKGKGGEGKKKGWRTSAVGYDDTPVLPGQKWKVHDIARPRPAVVTPGALPGQPPSDAVVLFDGKDLSQWINRGKPKSGGGEGPAKWRVTGGYMEIATGTGDLVSKEKFADAQYHIEWASPPVVNGDSQWRGNSGVLIMERYEIQVLDSHNNPTYADGGAGSIYGQWPPLVNAARKPGEWQSYDIIFEAPRFADGKLAKPAFVTVLQNGVLVHHRQEIIGPMAHRIWKRYEPHAPEESLALQDHDVPVRYRNIWVRRLKGYDHP